MEPTQAKTPRKRRRWLIVAFVLVLVSTISSWYWPRGDTRFVGKWSAHIEGNAGPYGIIVFRKNGESFFSPTGCEYSQRGPWRVEHNRLIMSGKTWPDSGILQPMINRLQTWMGIEFTLNVDLEPLQNESEGHTCVLRRIFN
jgi:hypothetical protein